MEEAVEKIYQLRENTQSREPSPLLREMISIAPTSLCGVLRYRIEVKRHSTCRGCELRSTIESLVNVPGNVPANEFGLCSAPKVVSMGTRRTQCLR